MGADGLPSPCQLGRGVCLHFRAKRLCTFTVSLAQICQGS